MMSGSILNQFRMYSGDPVAPQSVPLHGQNFAAWASHPVLSIPPGAIRSWMPQVKLQTIVCCLSENSIFLMSYREMSSLSVSVSDFYAVIYCVVRMMTAIFLPVLCRTELCVLVAKSCMEGDIWGRITWQALCIKNRKTKISSSW